MQIRESNPWLEWDHRQWATSDEGTPRTAVSPHWSLWQSAGVSPPRAPVALGRGDSELSGFGHNPG
jgi:hypothetical protein